MANKELNRLKVVLSEKKKTNKWLDEQQGKDKTIIIKCCTNIWQLDMGSLMKIAKLLEFEVTDLFRKIILLDKMNAINNIPLSLDCNADSEANCLMNVKDKAAMATTL